MSRKQLAAVKPQQGPTINDALAAAVSRLAGANTLNAYQQMKKEVMLLKRVIEQPTAEQRQQLGQGSRQLLQKFAAAITTCLRLLVAAADLEPSRLPPISVCAFVLLFAGYARCIAGYDQESSGDTAVKVDMAKQIATSGMGAECR